ncbi:hypothetical protein K469DRAFT_107429 [Zopfia rhizophila CBS 207.26]|uniref:Uncharacterized protein n=1 Tax=Zopfia rhizophila CBS 207.26 TaxID=1314779 RepID=A0A6A6ECD8_9PEZI|nr:hypothetical protein K469DRAFT_107429 [Zopfia rhizophila CBS 207.26]
MLRASISAISANATMSLSVELSTANSALLHYQLISDTLNSFPLFYLFHHMYFTTLHGVSVCCLRPPKTQGPGARMAVQRSRLH